MKIALAMIGLVFAMPPIARLLRYIVESEGRFNPINLWIRYVNFWMDL